MVHSRAVVAAAVGLGCAAGILSFAEPAAAAPAYDGFVESTSYPIRVHYTDAAGQDAAEEVLGYAEEGWALQIDQMGFPTPTAVDDDDQLVQGLWIYVDPAHGADQPEFIGDNPDTPWTDCTARVRISTLAPSSYLRLVTLHEMNHVLEYTADCGEPFFALEQSTVAVTTIIDPDDSVFPQYMLPVYQGNPHNSLHCTFYSDPNKLYFHYGSALFQLFLEEAYGDYDGKLIGGIWNAARQNGTVTSVGAGGAILDVDNDPDIFDAMDEVLGETSLEQAFGEFARWRAFVGTRDDGAHFRDGAKWTGGEIAVDTTLSVDLLPLVAGATEHQPGELGSVYVSLDPFGIETGRQGIRLAFDGDDDVAWQVDALVIHADGTADVESMALDGSAAGELILGPLTDCVELLFVFTNLGDGSRDPATPHCFAGAGFVYDLSVEDLAAPPTIAGVEPGELAVGETHYLWVSGTDFAAGLALALSGGGVEVGAVDFVDAETIGVSVTVAPDAALGARDLTVTNPNDESATLAGAVTIVDGAAVGDDGCSCAQPGGPRPADARWALTSLVGALLVSARRRRPTPSGRAKPGFRR